MQLERAVVLSAHAAGLRLSGWLARRGIAVRHLGLGPRPVARPWPAAWIGERSVLEPWLGRLIGVRPSRAVLVAGRQYDLSGRRRDLARFAGGTLVGLARDLRPRAFAPPSLQRWGRGRVGRVAWGTVIAPLLEKILGGDLEALPASTAGLLVAPTGASGWSCAGDATEVAEASAEAVLEAGGEPLEDVQVEGLEVEDGRVVAVRAEFGREHVDHRLYTDLAPARLAELLPAGTLPPEQVAALRGLRATDTALVTVRADAVGLPWEIWLADAGVSAIRVLRCWASPGEPHPDRVEVEVIDDGANDETLRERAIRALDSLAQARSASTVERLAGAWPVPATDVVAQSALARLDALGIVRVGRLALHLPLSVPGEARLAASWAASRDPATALRELLEAPRSVRGRAWLP